MNIRFLIRLFLTLSPLHHLFPHCDFFILFFGLLDVYVSADGQTDQSWSNPRIWNVGRPPCFGEVSRLNGVMRINGEDNVRSKRLFCFGGGGEINLDIFLFCH